VRGAVIHSIVLPWWGDLLAGLGVLVLVLVPLYLIHWTAKRRDRPDR